MGSGFGDVILASWLTGLSPGVGDGEEVSSWDAPEFDLDYYGKMIGKAWEEAAFVFKFIEERCG